MKFDPAIHHRSSIRLKGYDYSQAGMYFITICVQDRECFFGEIIVGGGHMGPHQTGPHRTISPQKMRLSEAGKMIDKWWQKIPEKFPDIELGVYQIMPNHFHAIVVNNGSGNIAVGVDPSVNPNNNNIIDHPLEINDSEIGQDFLDNGQDFLDNGQSHGIAPTVSISEKGPAQTGSPLSRVVQWFKTMTTNEYIRGVKNNGWPSFNGRLWQRNYWEHIIRNEQSYQRISEYIMNNPENWKEGKLSL